MEDFEWNVAHESQLLEAMMGHKPVGLNKHFQMACIYDKFCESSQKDIITEKIWAHLATMYNLEALDEGESIPFPNLERDFVLPEGDFGALLVKKEEEKKNATKSGRETPKIVKEAKKEEKSVLKNVKEVPRRDSKESREKTPVAKKEMKKEVDKSKPKSKSNSGAGKEKEETLKGKVKDDTPKPAKRPTRGSLKPDDSSSSGKSSPVTTSQPPTKRRRI